MTLEEIAQACTILFGPAAADPAFLHRLDRASVKRAFRRWALKIHPDRFCQKNDLVQAAATDRFIQVKRAHDLLLHFLDHRPPLKTRKSSAPGNVVGKDSRNADSPFSAGCFYWNGPIPCRFLRFGEYLYYRRVISWQDLIQALVWQRRQRPRIGEIATRWKWLKPAQLDHFLRCKPPRERLGSLLVRSGCISPFQLRILLYQQKRLQKPIGQYFVETGILSFLSLERYLRVQEEHNRRFGKREVSALHL